MTRSKELRRVEAAIAHGSQEELKWALGECELRRQMTKGHSALWHRIERRVRKALQEIRSDHSVE